MLESFRMVQDREFVDKLVVVGNTECECECASGGTSSLHFSVFRITQRHSASAHVNNCQQVFSKVSGAEISRPSQQLAFLKVAETI